MSEGHLLCATARGLIKVDYLQGQQFADALPGYEGASGEEAVRAIAKIYGELSDAQKDGMRAIVLRGDQLKWRYTDEGIKYIAEFYLIAIEEENIVLIQNLVGSIVRQLLLLKPAKTFHFGAMGLPGVGKSTALIAVILMILYGKVDGANNAALGRFLQKQLQCIQKLPPAIQEMIQQPGAPPAVYIDCNPGNMTPQKLQTAVREQMVIPDLEREDADLADVVGCFFLDEVDLIGPLAPAKKKAVIAQLQDLTEGNLNNKGWHRTGSRTTHHVKLFGWIGNITPKNSRNSQYILQQQSVQGQLKEMLSGKFTAGYRMPAALRIIILR
jgi:hypothetical protein